MKTYAATKNAGKLAEMQAMFAGSELEIATYPGYVAVAEDETSYIGNALLKARMLRAQLLDDGIEDAAVLADDSGLEVDVLGGRPGVLSARYGGEKTTWPQRRALLLEELKGVEEIRRSAHFVSAMALLVPGYEALPSIGVVEGFIVTEQHGEGGFGYDPLFFYSPLGGTFADLTPEEKNSVSHRRRAADALLVMLRLRA